MTNRTHLVSVPATRGPLSLDAVERAIGEIRRGRAVAVRGAAGVGILAMAAEAATDESMADLAQSRGALTLMITQRRAAVLGLAAAGLRPINVSFSAPLTAGVVEAFADPSCAGTPDVSLVATVAEVDAHSGEASAVVLAKAARLLPSAVIAPIRDPNADDLDAWASRHRRLLVDAGDVFQYPLTLARTLRPVAEARVPLLGAEDVRIIAFRPRDGGIEHIAIEIGTPPRDRPALVRLHSECFTGDLLGSLRCDCGDQLRGAIREITEAGGGFLLYLAQEGRGIGLVNKLRAYSLQDKGFDTVDANEQLGFDADERVYVPAAHMLRQLGIEQVRLLTNNPAKVGGLDRSGITVVERVPHHFPSNRHNETYMRTKAARAGHLF
jgi:GTP cyclohydrolase II